MDIFFEFVKEVLKGILRAISADLFRKTFLNKKKTTQRRSKQKEDAPHKAKYSPNRSCLF